MLEELISAAGTTIVAAMATSAYETARDKVTGLFRRFGSEEQAEEVEVMLDANAAQIERATDPERARLRLRGGWEQQMEDLLTDRPDAAQELEAAVARIREVLPVAQQNWIQSINASAPGAIAAGAMGGNVIIHPATPQE